MRETSRDYRHPHRPRAQAWIERGLAVVAGAPPALEPQVLVDEARRATGLGRFADDGFREPLERLCLALHEEARLTWTGWSLTRARLVGALVSQLRVADWFERHPEIADLDVPVPLFVTGLQRTGTTLLHRLLAADPARRALASWEALSPAPPPPRPWHRLLGERDPRQLTAAAAERTLSLLAPDFFAVHPVEADAPEEEVVLMDHTFVSQVSEASYHVPSFASWVVDQDHRVAYRHLRRCLQVLRFQRPEAPAHWVLKSPAHLEQLDALLDVFPDARIIQTHRDPRKTVASFCSMVAHGRGVFSDSVDPLEIGRHWLAKVHRMVTRASQSRQRRPEVFFDVAYLDLVADPVAKAAEVAAFAGRPLSEEAKTRLAAWHGQNPQHRFGRHVYTASDFGLSDDGIANTLADYVKEYGIESE